MHQVLMLLSELGNVMNPDVVIVNREMRIGNCEKVMEESHIKYRKGRAWE